MPIFGFVQSMGIVLSVADDVENVYLWNMCVFASIVEPSDHIVLSASILGLMKQNRNGPEKMYFINKCEAGAPKIFRITDNLKLFVLNRMRSVYNFE